MKMLKYLIALFVGAMLLSCNGLNDVPEFNDNDAFVAFGKTSMVVVENVGRVKVPVVLSSLSGVSATVSYIVCDSTAKLGEDFDVISSGTLHFTDEERELAIEIDIFDNDVYDGDRLFVVELTSVDNVQFGRDVTCVVKIEDDEHPLAFMLGEYYLSAENVASVPRNWTVKIDKDVDDPAKVWISNLVYGNGVVDVYGIVNAEKTELRIPVKQVISNLTIPGIEVSILLDGLYGSAGEEGIPSGGYLTAELGENGVITMNDRYGAYIYLDATDPYDWLELYKSCIMTKKK